MFERKQIRVWLAVAWLLAFAMMWLAFQHWSLPQKEVLAILNHLENSIVAENWPAATKGIDNLQDIWQRHRLLTLIINGGRDVVEFEQLMEQVVILVKYKNKDAIPYIGALKKALISVTVEAPVS